MRRDLSYRTSIEYIILLSVYIFISMILIFWTLDLKARIFKPEEKEKIHHLAICVFSPVFPLDFSPPPLPRIRFDSRFEAKLQSVKLSSVIREAKVTDLSWKEKVMRGLVDGHSRRLKIARRQWNMRSDSVDFRLYWGIRAIHLLSAFHHKSLLSLFFFFLRRSVTNRMITAWKDSLLNLTNFGCFRTLIDSK